MRLSIAMALLIPTIASTADIVLLDEFWTPELQITEVRAEEIDFEALDREGKPVSMRAKGFFARVLQHETDHLDGILFVDRVHFEDRKNLLEAYHETKIL